MLRLARTAARFDQRTLMTALARQFGRPLASRRAPRGDRATRLAASRIRTSSDSLTDSHARGAVLLAAVFEAFLTIYQRPNDGLDEDGGAVEKWLEPNASSDLAHLQGFATARMQAVDF